MTEPWTKAEIEASADLANAMIDEINTKLAQSGQQWTDTFDRSTARMGQPGTWEGVRYSGDGMQAIWSDPPPLGARGSVSVTCSSCGNVVTVSEGEEPIRYGDPRLCEHMGQKP